MRICGMLNTLRAPVGNILIFIRIRIRIWKVFRIGTVRYNWPMSAHASQAFRIAHCTDSEDLPRILHVVQSADPHYTRSHRVTSSLKIGVNCRPRETLL